FIPTFLLVGLKSDLHGLPPLRVERATRLDDRARNDLVACVADIRSEKNFVALDRQHGNAGRRSGGPTGKARRLVAYEPCGGSHGFVRPNVRFVRVLEAPRANTPIDDCPLLSARIDTGRGKHATVVVSARLRPRCVDRAL